MDLHELPWGQVQGKSTAKVKQCSDFQSCRSCKSHNKQSYKLAKTGSRSNTLGRLLCEAPSCSGIWVCDDWARDWRFTTNKTVVNNPSTHAAVTMYFFRMTRLLRSSAYSVLL